MPDSVVVSVNKWLSDYFADTRNLGSPALNALAELARTAQAEIESYRDLWAQRSDDADAATKEATANTELVAVATRGLQKALDWAECRNDASCDTEDSCRVCVELLEEGHNAKCWVPEVATAVQRLMDSRNPTNRIMCPKHPVTGVPTRIEQKAGQHVNFNFSCGCFAQAISVDTD